MCVPCRCVSRSEAPGWVKDTCALSKGALDQCRLKVLAWGENGSMPLSADNISASHRYYLRTFNGDLSASSAIMSGTSSRKNSFAPLSRRILMGIGQGVVEPVPRGDLVRSPIDAQSAIRSIAFVAIQSRRATVARLPTELVRAQFAAAARMR